ncbi:MAG: hypothetical protein KF699_15890 [Phycisphaeraceae bacterium]|nr:hypothetical protein [Phycisphaeraceae bacterium]
MVVLMTPEGRIVERVLERLMAQGCSRHDVMEMMKKSRGRKRIETSERRAALATPQSRRDQWHVKTQRVG